jgi:hypothetical protein
MGVLSGQWRHVFGGLARQYGRPFCDGHELELCDVEGAIPRSDRPAASLRFLSGESRGFDSRRGCRENGRNYDAAR